MFNKIRRKKHLNQSHKLPNILIKHVTTSKNGSESETPYNLHSMQYEVCCYTCMKSYNFVAHFISNPHEDVMVSVYGKYNGLRFNCMCTHECNKIPINLSYSITEQS